MTSRCASGFAPARVAAVWHAATTCYTAGVLHAAIVCYAAVVRRTATFSHTAATITPPCRPHARGGQVLHTRQQIAIFLFDNTPTRLSFSGAWPLLVAADDKARPPARTASLHRCIAALLHRCGAESLRGLDLLRDAACCAGRTDAALPDLLCRGAGGGLLPLAGVAHPTHRRGGRGAFPALQPSTFLILVTERTFLIVVIARVSLSGGGGVRDVAAFDGAVRQTPQTTLLAAAPLTHGRGREMRRARECSSVMLRGHQGQDVCACACVCVCSV
jgi:hypothetical protein